VVEKDEDEVNVAEDDAALIEEETGNNDDALLLDEPDVEPVTPEVAAWFHDRSHLSPWRNRHSVYLRFILVLVIAICATFVTSWYLFSGLSERQVVREIQPGIYSNIHLYSVETSGDPIYMSANLYSKLKDSLYTLNPADKNEVGVDACLLPQHEFIAEL
jgi:hypothetical protein